MRVGSWHLQLPINNSRLQWARIATTRFPFFDPKPTMACIGSDFIDTNIRGNRWHSTALVARMVGTLAFIGWFIAGTVGAVISTGLCLFTVVLGPAVSPQFVLRMHKAQPIEEHRSLQLTALYAELVRRADLSASPTL